MINDKAGVLAGKIWQALHDKGTLSGKDLKKAAGRITDKELYLALGWLAREGKICTAETEKDINVTLL